LHLSPRERRKSLQRENSLLEVCSQRLWRLGIVSYLRVWHRLRVLGAEHIPAELPFVLVANHGSHLDTLALLAALPRRHCSRVFPLAAGDYFFETPGLRAFATGLMNALPLWRKSCGRHALGELRARLSNDACGYILFPEGTRSRDGACGEFKAGLGMLVAESDVPVVPCFLDGVFQALPPGCKLPRPRRVTVRFGPVLQFGEVTNDPAGWREIAAVAHERVLRLHGVAGSNP
jgi:1-acyl-sn-glycerol-3-phosphate acyltransferase